MNLSNTNYKDTWPNDIQLKYPDINMTKLICTDPK